MVSLNQGVPAEQFIRRRGERRRPRHQGVGWFGPAEGWPDLRITVESRHWAV